VDSLDVLYPFARRVLDVGGQELAYIDEGPRDKGRGDEGRGAEATRPAVLCVHGNPTWGFAYRDLIHGLRTDHRVIVPDHVGMGRSSRPSPGAYPFTLARRIDDLTALVDHVLPRGPVDLVVHDWGGPIGLGWAVRHPERVGRVLVLNTAAFPLPPGEPLPWLLRLARSPVGTALSRMGAFSLATLLLGVHHRVSWPVARGYLAPYRSPRDRAAIVEFVHDIPVGPADPAWGPLRETAERLDVLRDHRVVICWGLRDPVFTRSVLAEWRRRLPGATVTELADAGHLVTEDAGDRVLAEARRLFAAPESGA
jgi:cis-3-alkyl-4-acyloxetan-2-one decarboxylase